jgi:hypothetical protein
LLSCSLRIDLFFQYDDATWNSVLRVSGLFYLQSYDEDGRVTLDSQILVLARAIIVRGSKLLILDEGAHFSLPSGSG